MATLIPSLAALRDEFNRTFPGRSRYSDGWIGDAAHQAGPSDHNPDERGYVHAIDVTKDLNTPGASMQEIVNKIVADCRAGRETRLTYVIFNRRIASASRGWTWRDYSGSNPHDKHAHFSGSNAPAKERNTARWALIEKGKDVLDNDDQKVIRGIVKEVVIEELNSWAKRDPIASIFARTGYVANQAMPALLSSVGQIKADELSPEEIDALAAAIVEAMPEGLAGAVRSRL